MKPIYIDNYIENNLELFYTLRDELEWVNTGKPRQEYFMATDSNLIYAYDKISNAAEYVSKQFHSDVIPLLNKLNEDFTSDYNVAFLNRYDTGKDFLGWHQDSGPNMNSKHPICVVSLGEMAREIWWKKPEDKGVVPQENKQLLKPGSLFIMPAGFQELYFHRIPKSDKQDMKPRISLTFRNYIKD